MKVRDAKLALLAGASLVLCGPLAQAADVPAPVTGNSVSITATGQVAVACTVALDAGGSSSTVSLGDLTQSGSGVSLGGVKEVCNNSTGYKVTLTSANKGVLKGAIAANTTAIPYTLTYGGTAVTLSSGTATVTSASAPTGSTTPDNPVVIGWSGSSSLTADTYSDLLTFTMAAN